MTGITTRRMLFVMSFAIATTNVMATAQEDSSTQEEPTAETRRPDSNPKRIDAPEAPVNWPMRLAKGRPVPVIEVKVNGEGPFLFFLDTGATIATLNTAFVEKMNLPVGEKTTIRGPGTEGIPADIVTVESMEIGGFRFEEFEAAGFDRSQFAGGEDMAGSVGLDLFGDHPLTIDYANNEIRVGGDGLPEPDGQKVLACEFDGLLPSFEIELAGTSFTTVLDTGASCLIAAADESADKIKFSSEPSVMGRGRTISGEFEIKGATLDGDLTVGAHALSTPMMILVPELPESDMCVLGYHWVRDFSVTYDRKNGRIGFEKPEKESDK